MIAVSGAEDVAVQLERLLPRMSVNGRRVVAPPRHARAELDGVHILYIGAKAFPRTRALRAAAIERPILIVTDDEHGLDAGGVINFIEVDRNVRFEISLIAADRSGLKINSALLSVAARVERRPQGAVRCVDGYPTDSDPMAATSGWPAQVCGEELEGLVSAICIAGRIAGSRRRRRRN